MEEVHIPRVRRTSGRANPIRDSPHTQEGYTDSSNDAQKLALKRDKVIIVPHLPQLTSYRNRSS